MIAHVMCRKPSINTTGTVPVEHGAHKALFPGRRGWYASVEDHMEITENVSTDLQAGEGTKFVSGTEKPMQCANLVRCVAAMAAVLLLLASCSEHARSDRPTMLVFSYDEGGELKEKVLAQLISEFEKENPGVKVHKHVLPGVTDLERSFYLSSFKAESNFVDVFELDPIWTSEFAAGELLHPLDDYLSSEARSSYLDFALEQSTYAGKLYAIPHYVTYSVLFYRKDLLKKHSAQPPTTWEELVKQAREVGEKEGIHGLLWQGAEYEGAVCNLFQLYYNMGGTVDTVDDKLVLDEAALTRALTFMHDSIYNEGISPESVSDHLGEDSEALFADGRALFMVNTQAAVLYLQDSSVKEKFGIAALPGGVTLTGGWHLAVNRRSTNPELAFKFAVFMASEGNQVRALVERGQGPVLKELYRDGLPGPAELDPLRALIAHVRSRPASPYYHPFSAMVATQVHDVAAGSRTPQEAAREILERSANQDFPKEAPPDFADKFGRWY